MKAIRQRKVSPQVPKGSTQVLPKSSIGPRPWLVVRAVGWVTFLEVIRDKILYNIILCSFLLFGVGFFASRLSFSRPERIILDFGLSAVSISCAMIAMFTGAALLGREFDRRTIYVTLSHPISRSQFILGKFAGLMAVLGLNWLLLSGSYLLILFISSDAGTQVLSSTLFIGLLFILIQSAILASISILFSTFSTTSLSIIVAIGFYLIGNNISQIKFIAARLSSPVGSFTLSWIAKILPNFEYFNLGMKVTYGLPVPFPLTAYSILYGFFVIGLFLSLAGLFIQAREV